MTEDTTTWPIGLRRIAEVIGAAAAVRLAEAVGGTEDNRIPIKARIDHPFVEIIGLDRFEKLCEAFPGRKIQIPRGVFRDLKKAAILQAEGTHRHVALSLRCTQRYVRKVRGLLTGEREPDLFSGVDAIDLPRHSPPRKK